MSPRWRRPSTTIWRITTTDANHRLADALEGHPQRDPLFQVIQLIDQLCEAERIDLANGAMAQALAAGTEERERLRGELQERQEKLDQVLAMLVTPASDMKFEASH